MTDAEVARDEAIARVEQSSSDFVREVVNWVCLNLFEGTEFTTDLLWTIFPSPPEPRAMGAAMVKLKTLRIIEGTGRYQKSTRTECHARPVAIWRRK